jgi:hypothetical protein
MNIVAIGWMYVVLLMSLTENSFVAGVLTFVFYGAVPVGIIWYLSGSGKRRASARAAQEAALESQPVSTATHETSASPQVPTPPPPLSSAPESLPPPSRDLP